MGCQTERADAAALLSSSGAGPVTGTVRSLDGMTILVVDDDADSRDLVKRLRVCQLEFRKQQQQWNAALPHFLHPTEEIYGDIQGELAGYNVPPFDGALKALAQVVKGRKGGQGSQGRQ